MSLNLSILEIARYFLNYSKAKKTNITNFFPTNQNRVRRETEDNVEVLVSEDDSCMFYADKLYWGDINGPGPSGGNYTLDLDRSSCTTNQSITPNGNSTSAVYEFCKKYKLQSTNINFSIQS